MTTLLKQVVVLAIGVVAAAAMVWLGLWQMQAFVDSGNRTITDRAAQPPVALADVLTPDGVDGDAYGKRVTATGEYVASQEILIRTGDGFRVLTALELDDGRILPVVRGQVSERVATPPAPPGGDVVQTGLLLPGEGDIDTTVPGELGSVSMPQLVQEWQQQLVPGFITLDEADAQAQGLRPAGVDLPAGQGSFQNGGYALQWWIFAAVALAIAGRVAIGIGRGDRARLEEAAAAGLRPTPTDERNQTP